MSDVLIIYTIEILVLGFQIEITDSERDERKTPGKLYNLIFHTHRCKHIAEPYKSLCVSNFVFFSLFA